MVKSVLYPAAYTLIEVLVAITIMSIMATIVLFGYSSQRTSHDLDNVAREMVAVVREIQNSSLTGKIATETGIPAAALPCSYQISWTNGSANYDIKYSYKSSSSSDCSTVTTVTLRTVTLKSGVQFDNTNSIGFSLPYAVSSGGTMRLHKGVSSAVVCVSANGLIDSHAGTSCP